MSAPRVWIKPKVYRGRDGFLVSGLDAIGRRVRIHTETREKAGAIVRAIKDGAGGDYFEAVGRILLARA